MSFARLRASPSSSVPTAPSVNLRVLPPKSYITTHLREPPLRKRIPKPGRLSQKKVLSLVPGGSVSVLMVEVVNCIRNNPLGRLWVGRPCCLLPPHAFYALGQY